MTRKLLTKADVLLVRDVSVKGIWVTPQELRLVISLVGEVAYALYTLYRTYPFLEAEEISDSGIGKLIGWPERKVQKYRTMLENADLFRSCRYGTKTDGITKVFVGLETVALFNAGLPVNVPFPKAIAKLKKELNITTPEEFVQNVPTMIHLFESDPKNYL